MKRSRRKRDLQGWLGEASTAVFVLDRELRLSAFNSGCESLTGWSADEVLGQECRYASIADDLTPTALGASLCPPPDIFEVAEGLAPAFIPTKSGASLPRLIHFFLLKDAEGATGVLGLITEIPEPPKATVVPPARQLHAELAAVRMQLRERFGSHSLVVRSSAMQQALVQLQLAQTCSANVLLQGEPGTGKEHLARHIHFGSAAKAQWFVPLDCRRLDPQDVSRVIERLQEVHRPTGSGAVQPGTLFLADVDLLPRDLQSQMVVAFNPADLGSKSLIRLIASATSPLEELVADGKLLPEFQALIETLTIRIPPLRERNDDLQLLAQHFLEEVNREKITVAGSGSRTKQIAGFDEAVWPLFLRYNWPGNLDELAAVVREAHDRGNESLIKASDLPFRFRSALDAQELPPPVEAPPMPLDPLLTRVETRLILLALERGKYNKSRAAELLGINRARLYRRMEQLGIEDRDPERDGDAGVEESKDSLEKSADG